MSTRIEFRWPDDLVAAIDGLRGSTPRSAFVRDITTKELARQGVPLWKAPAAPHSPAKDVAVAFPSQRYSCPHGCRSESGGLCENHRELLRKL